MRSFFIFAANDEGDAKHDGHRSDETHDIDFLIVSNDANKISNNDGDEHKRRDDCVIMGQQEPGGEGIEADGYGQS
jgi:hypothetical protein